MDDESLDPGDRKSTPVHRSGSRSIASPSEDEKKFKVIKGGFKGMASNTNSGNQRFNHGNANVLNYGRSSRTGSRRQSVSKDKRTSQMQQMNTTGGPLPMG